jgi:hypothetical protein
LLVGPGQIVLQDDPALGRPARIHDARRLQLVLDGIHDVAGHRYGARYGGGRSFRCLLGPDTAGQRHLLQIRQQLAKLDNRQQEYNPDRQVQDQLQRHTSAASSAPKLAAYSQVTRRMEMAHGVLTFLGVTIDQ